MTFRMDVDFDYRMLSIEESVVLSVYSSSNVEKKTRIIPMNEREESWVREGLRYYNEVQKFLKAKINEEYPIDF